MLSAATPLSATTTSTILALSGDESDNIIENPTPREIEKATSVHVFAFTSQGKLLLNESEGLFAMEDWENYYDHARKLCCPANVIDDADAMQDDMMSGSEAAQLIKSALQAKVEDDLYWKG